MKTQLNPRDDQLKLSDFDFSFPPELIAQRRKEKGLSKILHCPYGGEPKVINAKDIVDYISPADCIVVNNTKVIPARLFGKKATGGKIEALLVQRRPEYAGLCWEAWVKPGQAFQVGNCLAFGSQKAEVKEILPDGGRILDFRMEENNFSEFLNSQGSTPIPPYIKRAPDEIDKIDYQSVFACYDGAVAAPTASFHFSEAMVSELKNKGVKFAEVTLHVGPGTFKPVDEEDYREHKIHGEKYFIDQVNADLINKCKSEGGRIICIGTTATRVIETVATDDGVVMPGEGVTYKYIHPGYKWKTVNGLLTNFHWPRSTLILLVASFYGVGKTKAAYQYAIDHKMQLFSYGDGMLIL